MKVPTKPKFWEPKHDALLTKLALAGDTWDSIAKALSRSNSTSQRRWLIIATEEQKSAREKLIRTRPKQQGRGFVEPEFLEDAGDAMFGCATSELFKDDPKAIRDTGSHQPLRRPEPYVIGRRS